VFGTIQLTARGIRLSSEEQRLDLSRYPEEFSEFSQ
jgi:hypothetical protein